MLQQAVQPQEPGTDAVIWNTRTDYPGAAVYRGNHGAWERQTADSCFLYAIGGQGASVTNVCYRYATRTNTWTAMPNLPIAFSNMAAVYWQDNGTGTDSSGVFTLGAYTGSYLTNCYKWTKGASTWDTFPRYPGTQTMAGNMACVIGDSIFLMYNSTSFARYSIRQGTWAARATPANSNYYGAMTSFRGCVYQLGGWMDVKTFQRFTPTTNTWATLASPSQNVGGNTGCLAGWSVAGLNRVYAWGGGTAWTPWDNVAYYDSASNAWTADGVLPTVVLGAFYGPIREGTTEGINHATGYNGSANLTLHRRGIPIIPVSCDVGVAAITIPGTGFTPGTPLTPTCQVTNYGLSPQSNIPVRAWIDSLGTRIYNQTAQIAGPLAPGASILVPFSPQWIPANYGPYNVTMFTYLALDSNYINDTARVATAPGWERIPPNPTNTDRLCHATVYDPVGDKIYMIGGCAAGVAGTNLADCARFDPVTNIWTQMAPKPTATDWGEGSYCRGKIYYIGGYTNSSTVQANNEAYTIATNTWTTLAPRPTVAMSGPQVTWRDSLIYCLGGYTGAGSAVVDIYNPFTNTWATGTPLPMVTDMTSGAIIGDTIYFTGGYNRGTGACWPNFVKGAINPANPTQITYITAQAFTSPVFNQASATLGNWVFWYGGYINAATSTPNGWKYDRTTGLITAFTPHLAGAAGITRCQFMAGREQGALSGLYTMAGDSAGDWNAPNRIYAKLGISVAPLVDVGIGAIHRPASKIDSGVAITPTIRVKNFGQTAESSFAVTFKIDSAGTTIYSSGVIAPKLLPGDTVRMTFTPDWTPGARMWTCYKVTVATLLAGDVRPTNDTMRAMCIRSTDTVYSDRFSGAAPTIDGYMGAGEWDDAYYANVSNVAKGYGPRAAEVWLKHDADFLYIAGAMPQAMDRDNGDRIGLYVDENNNGQWEMDRSEGDYQIWVNGSGADEVQYRYWTPPSVPGVYATVPGALSASGVYNGYLVFEAKLPLGTDPYKLNLNPNTDTCGLHLYELDNNTDWYGWWKPGLWVDSLGKPAYYGKLVLRTSQIGNVGVTKILAPVNSYLPNTEVTPKATWKNTGKTHMNFAAYMMLTDPSGTRVYTRSLPGSLDGGQIVDLAFPSYTVVDLGDWAVKCSTVAAGDNNPADNVLEGTFKVAETPPPPPGWKEVADIPLMPSGRAIKDGGCLAYDAGTDAIYASKGYKTGDFYKYEVSGDWTILSGVPFGGDGKQVYKGSCICSDGNGKMYLVKGNNTMGFWEYDAATDVWTQMSNVPYGESGKKVKQGAGIAWAQGAAYLLKGYRNEFYKYDPAAGWITLTPAPIGWHKKWDAGSWLVSDGDHTLYAFKGKYHEFYTYDVITGEWSTFLHAMPIPGNAGNKKAKDGSCAAWFDGDIYALKGGNTTEFWHYFPLADSWVQQADIPLYGNSGRRKKVKQGGALAGYPGAGGLYAFKGNKTYEFWRYGVTAMDGAQPSREGVMAGNLNIGDVSFAIAPNPLAGGLATVRYSLPKAGLATLYVYDVTGRTVLTQTLAAGRTGTAGLDLRKLDAGVYLVKVATEGFSTTQKLVVQH